MNNGLTIYDFQFENSDLPFAEFGACRVQIF